MSVPTGGPLNEARNVRGVGGKASAPAPGPGPGVERIPHTTPLPVATDAVGGVVGKTPVPPTKPLVMAGGPPGSETVPKLLHIPVPAAKGEGAAPNATVFVGGGPEAVRLSEQTMDSWLAFARSGDPSHDSLPGGRWPAYEPERRSTLRLGPETIVEDAPADGERAVWEELL